LYQKCLPDCLPKAKALPKGRISKRSVDALQCPPGKDRTFLWDDAIAGFGVVAFPSGRKVYIAQYRHAGRSRRSTIGDHGGLAPERARSEAKKLLGAVESGGDPIAERQAALAVPTFGEAAQTFMRLHVAAKRKPRTLESYETLLRAHILPSIGTMRLPEIRRAHISALHGNIKTPGAANRAVSVVSAIFELGRGRT
jgi:hypothetical protein